jgi:hypothetical protein
MFLPLSVKLNVRGPSQLFHIRDERILFIRNNLGNTYLGHEFSQDFFSGLIAMNCVFLSNYKLFSFGKLKRGRPRDHAVPRARLS